MVYDPTRSLGTNDLVLRQRDNLSQSKLSRAGVLEYIGDPNSPAAKLYLTLVGAGTPPSSALERVELALGAGASSLANGTAANPSLAFASNPSLGLYRAALNTLGIASNGAGRMTVSDTAITALVDMVFAAGVSFSGPMKIDAEQINAANSSLLRTWKTRVDLNNTGARVVTLFAPILSDVGSEWQLWDAAQTALTNNVSIAVPGGVTINGGAGPFVLAENSGSVDVRCVAVNAWKTVGRG